MLPFTLSGLLILAVGLYVRLGGFKALYLTKWLPVTVVRSIQALFIPVGAICLLLVLLNSLESPETGRVILFGLICPLQIAAFAIAVRTPKWLLPGWLVFLEKKYGPAAWLLLKDAADDPGTWSKRAKTRAGLSEWAEETREKLGLPE